MIHKRAVERALRRAKVKYWTGRRSKVIHMLCPFHKDRKTPSLVIYTDNPVRIHCFGCNVHGDWALLDSKLGNLDELESEYDDPAAGVNLDWEVASIAQVPCLPYRTRSWSNGKFREVGERTLDRLHSRWWFDEIDRTERIVWPVWDLGCELVGWVGRRLDSEDSIRKYRNMPAMDVLGTLWPLPQVGPETDVKRVVLVEGPYDALRLLYHGVPALATLGTAWSHARSLLIDMLGAKTAVLAFDADRGGKEATTRVGGSLRHYERRRVNVWEWEWPRNKDPGNAPRSAIRELKQAMELPLKTKPHRWISHVPDFSPHWLPG